MINEIVRAQIAELNKQGHSRSSISRITGVCRSTVAKYIDNPNIVCQPTGVASPLEPYKDLIKQCFFASGGNCAATMKLFEAKLGEPIGVNPRTFRYFCSRWREELRKTG